MTKKSATKLPSFDEMMNYRHKRYKEFYRKVEEVKKEVFGDLDDYYLNRERDRYSDKYGNP